MLIFSHTLVDKSLKNRQENKLLGARIALVSRLQLAPLLICTAAAKKYDGVVHSYVLGYKHWKMIPGHCQVTTIIMSGYTFAIH